MYCPACQILRLLGYCSMQRSACNCNKDIIIIINIITLPEDGEYINHSLLICSPFTCLRNIMKRVKYLAVPSSYYLREAEKSPSKCWHSTGSILHQCSCTALVMFLHNPTSFWRTWICLSWSITLKSWSVLAVSCGSTVCTAVDSESKSVAVTSLAVL